MRKVSPLDAALVGLAVHVYGLFCPAVIGEVALPSASARFVFAPNVIVAPVTVVAAVPVLDSVTTQLMAVVPVQEALPETLAPDVNDPNRPNTNPAMAMAAMSVMAMRMTVAMTGDIPFL